MKRWIYVRVDAPREDLTMVSFDHCLVEALSEESAYGEGSNYFDKNPNDVMMKGWRFLNDYVIAL